MARAATEISPHPESAMRAHETEMRNRTWNEGGSSLSAAPLVQHVQPSPTKGPSSWLVVGGCVGGAVALALVVIAWLVVRVRRNKRKRSFAEAHGFVAIRRPSEGKSVPISQYLSSGSDTSEVHPVPASPARSSWRSKVAPSASLDLGCASPYVENGRLPRWNSVSSSIYPTTVIGTVQPDLYRSSDEEEGTCSPPCSNGRLWFSLQYSPDEEQLTVHLLKAKYLPGRGVGGAPRDPFVRLMLLPDEENWQQSKARKRTLSPKFNEIFTFRLEPWDLANRTLSMSVYDIDKKKVRHSLGHVLIPLSRVDLFTNDVIWRDLENTWQPAVSLGELEVCLSCNPFTNKVKATVCRLRYVAPHCPENSTSADAAAVYVKVQLFHGEKLVKTKCTHLRRSRCSSEGDDVPFEETFAFGVSGRYLDACSLVFTVCAVDGNREIPHGRVVLGPFLYARGDQLAHWQEMMSNPRHHVTRWHRLESVPHTTTNNNTICNAE